MQFSNQKLLASTTLGGEIFLIGGVLNGTISHDGVLSYNPATDTVERKAGLPIGVDSGAACSVNGKIYHMGGFSGSPVPLSKVFEYDPQADEWTQKKDMPTPRAGFALGVGFGKIMAFGGYSEGNRTARVIDVYDPERDEWVEEIEMPNQRSWFSLIRLNDLFYLLGGTTGPFNAWGWPPPDFLKSVESFNPRDFIYVNPSGKLPVVWGKIKGVANNSSLKKGRVPPTKSQLKNGPQIGADSNASFR